MQRFVRHVECVVLTELAQRVVTAPVSLLNRVVCAFPVVSPEPATKLGRWRNVGEKSTTHGDTHDPGYEAASGHLPAAKELK